MSLPSPSTLERGVDVTAATIPAAAAAYAGHALGPLLGYAAPSAMGVAGLGMFFAAFLTMTRTGRPSPTFKIASFANRGDESSMAEARILADQFYAKCLVIDESILYDQLDNDDGLLLEDEVPRILDQPFVDGQVGNLAELLLDDPLPLPPENSRVVQLFAPQSMPTAGQLAHRIDRHLGHAPLLERQDDTDALHEALEELRRSLRRA